MKPLQRLGPLDHVSLPSGVLLELVAVHDDEATCSTRQLATLRVIIEDASLKKANWISRLSLGSPRIKRELVGAN